MSRSSNKGACVAMAAIALTACGSRTIPASGSLLSLSGGDYALPVRNMVERRYLTVVRQKYDFSCGSAALATLLHYHYDEAQNEQSIFMGMWRTGDQARIRQVGFSLLDMKRYLNARGIRADGYKVTLADIEHTKIPGIALIDLKGYRHFVVVKGVENGQVLVGDPSLGIRLIDTGNFQKMWNGILFALGDDTARGKLSFGRDSEWALVARSRATMMMEPASLQALALTRAPSFPVEL